MTDLGDWPAPLNECAYCGEPCEGEYCSLDAWHGVDLSFKSDLCDQYETLHDALQNISKAIEQD